MNLNKVLCSIVFLIPISFIFAQDQDSISQKNPQRVTAYYADKFASVRPLNIEYTQLTPYKFSSEHLGNDYTDGKVRNLYQLKASANGNFIVKKNWMLGATLNYNYISSSVEMNQPDGTMRVVDNDFHYHSTSINFTYISKLWNKPMIYSASAIVDGSEKHFERFKGLITGTLLLKMNQTTKMSVGLVGIIDPSAQVPVIPTFIYDHKFGNGWNLDVILPKRVFIKKNISENSRISLGSELDGTSFYLYDQFGTNEKYELRQLEINSGIVYEHHLGGSFVATAKTGLRNSPNSRIFKKNESFDSYIFDVTPKSTFYFNLGISFNPFGKFFK